MKIRQGLAFCRQVQLVRKRSTASMPCNALSCGERGFDNWVEAMPKEMLPMVVERVVQTIVEQLVAAGVTDRRLLSRVASRRTMGWTLEWNGLAGNGCCGAKVRRFLQNRIKDIAELANFILCAPKRCHPKGKCSPTFRMRHTLPGDDGPFFMFCRRFLQKCEVPHAKQLH